MDLLSPFDLPRFPGFLPSRILPGPMEGVTTGAFLGLLTERQWVRVWWTPFLRISEGIPRTARLKAWLEPYLSTGLPVIAQLMGVHTGRLVEAAKGLRKLGACAIDLNCACPSDIVVGNGAGGGRLREPGWIQETLRALRESLDCPLGVKLRIGFASPEEFSRNLAPILRGGAVDFFTLHYRTVSEGYREVPGGWSRLTEARRLLPELPMIGSGNLWAVQDIRRMAQECGVDAVAPARGLLRNPRLLRDAESFLRGEEVPALDLDARQSLLQDFRTRGTPLGFLLQMAANLLRKDSPEFRAFLQKTLADSATGRQSEILQ